MNEEERLRNKEYQRRHKEKNPEAWREAKRKSTRKYREANPDKVREQQERARKKRAALKLPQDAEASRKRNADYRERNLEAVRARGKAWRAANPEKVSENARRHRLKKEYGITLEEYNRMWEEQDGKCGICGKPETSVVRGSLCWLSVDHCHDNGHVRGLLCAHCNRALRNEEWLVAALEYVRKANLKENNGTRQRQDDPL